MYLCFIRLKSFLKSAVYYSLIHLRLLPGNFFFFTRVMNCYFFPVPPDLFLLGCIFVIVEYDVQRPNDVSVWKQVIERHGGEVEPQYCTRATHVLAITQKHPTVVQALREGKRCVSAHWLSDVVSKQQVVPPWHALHFPTPFSLTELPCAKQIVSLSGFEGEERAKVKYMLEALGAKVTNYFTRHNTLLVCRR